MEMPTLLAALSAALMASGIGILALWVLPPRKGAVTNSIFSEAEVGTLLLFDGETLIDSTPDGRALLAITRTTGSAWDKLMAYLTPRFGDPEAQLAQVAAEGALELASLGHVHPMLLRADYRNGITKIELIDAAEADKISTDPLSQRAILEEVTLLRDAVAAAPMLAWREDDRGEVIWANGAYLLQACALLTDGKELGWPLPKLFPAIPPEEAGLEKGEQRVGLTLPKDKQAWFNISSKHSEQGWLRYAVPADAAVQAEASLRDFMQTLTKTFAQLPIGLAIFDSSRKLQLFNPALLDLTHLPVEFLSMRPSLMAFLNSMRDKKMLPEPKDFRSWRRELTDMENAAASGQYEETWNLPDGQTYKVIGRPHPNGAVALMFEDISTEMLRTRRFRADLDLGQSVIDQVEDAIAVFDQGGQLVMSNSAYAGLWGHDPSEWIEESNLRKLTTHWRSVSAPTALWAEVEEYVSTIGDRAPWQAESRFLDGRLVSCKFSPLAAGATLAQFRIQHVTQVDRPKLAAKKHSA
jgi:PAS domain-containing protein